MNLPVEILLAILRYNRAFLQVLLWYRHLRPFAQSLIFKAVAVDSTEKSLEMISHLAGNPELCAKVESVTITNYREHDLAHIEFLFTNAVQIREITFTTQTKTLYERIPWDVISKRPSLNSLQFLSRITRVKMVLELLNTWTFANLERVALVPMEGAPY